LSEFIAAPGALKAGVSVEVEGLTLLRGCATDYSPWQIQKEAAMNTLLRTGANVSPDKTNPAVTENNLREVTLSLMSFRKMT